LLSCAEEEEEEEEGEEEEEEWEWGAGDCSECSDSDGADIMKRISTSISIVWCVVYVSEAEEAQCGCALYEMPLFPDFYF